MADDRSPKHAINLAIIWGVGAIVADLYLNGKKGQMTFSQALEYAKKKNGYWVVWLTGGLLFLFFIHVFWRGERQIVRWLLNLLGKD
jgi:hypothetical protein